MPVSGAEIRRAALRGAEKALESAAQDLAARAALEAPIETGTLRASVSPGPGGPLVKRVGHDTVEVDVTFDTVYAARQHEEITWHHPRGGKAKYLEDPLKAMAARYEAVVGASVRKEINELEARSRG